MDKMKKGSEGAFWMERIERATKAIKDLRDEAQKYKSAYMGEFRKDRKSLRSRNSMEVNFIYKYIDTIMPSMLAQNPKIIARAKNQESENNAINIQENINYWFYELDARAEFKDVVFDSFMGRGAVVQGWDYETKIEEEEAEQPVLNEFGEIVGVQAVRQKVEKTVKDQPFIKWIDYWNDVRIDPDVKKERHCRWKAYREVVPVDVFKKDERYDADVRKKAKGGMRPEDVEEEQSFFRDGEEQNSLNEWIELWHIFDTQERQYLVIVPGSDKPAQKMEWPYEFEVKNDPFPITFFTLKDHPFNNQGFSEFRAFFDQIEELNRLRSMELSIMKRQAPRFLYNKASATRAQMSKFLHSDALEATEVNDPSGILPAPVPNIPPDMYNWNAVVASDLGETSGLAEFDAANQASTATEASILEGRINVRKRARNFEFENFIATVGAKMAGLLQQFQEEETTIRIQRDTDVSWMRISNEDIRGEFDICIEPGVMQHKNEAIERRDTIRFAEAMMNNPATNQRWLAQEIAKAFNKDPSKALISAEDQMAQLEAKVQELQAALDEKEKPKLEFADIKYEDLKPVDQMQILQAAKAEAGVAPPVPDATQIVDQAQSLLNQGQIAQQMTPMNGGVEMPGGEETPLQDIQPESLDGING